MKKFIFCLLLFFSFAAAGECAPEEAPEQNFIVERVFSDLSVEGVNRFVAEMNGQLDQPLPLLNLDTLQSILWQGGSLDLKGGAVFLLKKLFEELVHQMGLMGKLLFLAVLCALLRNLQNAFENSGISLLAYSVCFSFLAVFAIHAFYDAMQLATRTIGYMVSFMEALLPLMITLLAGVGAITSAALFSPLMLFSVSVVATAVKHIVLPLLLLGAALECANYLADTYRMTQLTALFKQAGMLVLGFLMVIFIGIITIQGVAGAVTDGLALRTAKFATSTFIPVVGKVFSDTVELVMGASLLLKNAVGIFGVLTIGGLCLMPLVKMFSLVVVMKLTGALLEPMGDVKMAQCLTGMGNNLLLVTGALLTVALMFFLAITMIVGAGSAAVMLR